MILKGNFTALVTPFKKNKDIDFISLKNLIAYQLQNRTDGLVLLGSTAEAPTLSSLEKHLIIETAITETNHIIPIIAGINAFSTDDALLQAKQRFVDGADALLVSPPPYIKPTESGLEHFFKTIADYSYIPIILYNIPSRTGVSIPSSLVKKLSFHPNIIGIKEASGDMNYATDIAPSINENFAMLVGNDNLLLPLLSIGATGIISVYGNISPNLLSDTISLFLENKVESSRILYKEILPIISCLSLESNPIPIKYILSQLNMIKPYYREPLCSPSKSNQYKIKKLIKALYLSKHYQLFN